MKCTESHRSICHHVALWLATFVLLSGLATAEETEAPALYLGPVLYHRSGPWLADSARGLYPTGDYEGERLLIRGDTIGLRLFSRNDVTFNAIVQNDLLSFRARDADTAALRALDDRKDSFNGGVEASWKPTPDDNLRAAVLADVANRYHSALCSVAASHTFTIASTYTQLVPRFGWTHFRAGYTNYYFGISPAESLRSGLPVFRPGAADRLDLGVTLVQPLSRDLVTFFDIARKRFGNDAGNSPLLEKRSYVETGIGVLWNVKKLF